MDWQLITPVIISECIATITEIIASIAIAWDLRRPNILIFLLLIAEVETVLVLMVMILECAINWSLNLKNAYCHANIMTERDQNY